IVEGPDVSRNEPCWCRLAEVRGGVDEDVRFAVAPYVVPSNQATLNHFAAASAHTTAEEADVLRGRVRRKDQCLVVDRPCGKFHHLPMADRTRIAVGSESLLARIPQSREEVLGKLKSLIGTIPDRKQVTAVDTEFQCRKHEDA